MLKHLTCHWRCIWCLSQTLIVAVWLTVGLTACYSEKKGQDQQEVRKVNNDQFFTYMRPYLQQGYLVRMIPGGISMLPTIHHNEDVVTLSMTDSLKVGDIALTEIDSAHYVLHRIVKMTGDSIVLKGDHNKTVEQARKQEVMAIVRDIEIGGAARSVLRSTDGMVGESAVFQKNPNIFLDCHNGHAIVVDTLEKCVDMRRIIDFNDTALLLWKATPHEMFRIQDMADILLENYEIDSLKAKKDCIQLVDIWMQYGLVKIRQ